MLVLSLFPGIDLLGRGFEEEGFCVVRSPDPIFGGDIRNFTPPALRFDGVIGGSPCQDFSRARRDPPTGYGLEMLGEFTRVITQARPTWWLLENVERAPTIHIEGYHTQRLDLNALECGLPQRRLRHFQFGSPTDRPITISPKRDSPANHKSEPTCTATEGKRANRRAWAKFCQLQGLPPDFDLPGWTTEAKYRAVGNGVPIPMARTIARAIALAIYAPRLQPKRLCICGRGRPLTDRADQTSATPACRKRMEMRRKAAAGHRGITHAQEEDGSQPDTF